MIRNARSLATMKFSRDYVLAFLPLNTTGKFTSQRLRPSCLLLKVARTMRGTAGPDGWTGPELSHLPLEALTNLLCVGRALERYTRPIPILNAHWRLWASSWLQTDGFRQWIDKHIPDNVRARKGFSIIGTATGILEDFSEEGYALSLDWSKCFDCLAPAVTALPRGLALVCADIWSHQVRWVSWSGCTHNEPLRTATSVPQKDPFGPLAAMLWVI